jgi:hypothetical protein
MTPIVCIEIETAIRKLSWASFQAGQKSVQKVTVDFTLRKVASQFYTGKTKVLGIELGSVRDRFALTAQRFTEDGTACFTVTGQTASAVTVLPNINYTFDFQVSQTDVIFSGRHDGYPSYHIAIDGASAYDHVQGHIGQLAGSADVLVSRRTHHL